MSIWRMVDMTRGTLKIQIAINLFIDTFLIKVKFLSLMKIFLKNILLADY
jgi:hypothetical protein